MEIDVKGHSGCNVDIRREGNELFIYKSTFDTQYFSRLCLQAKKQKIAGKQEYQHMRIPEIYEVSQNDKCVLIKMEYVYSKNFIEYFESAGFEQITYFIKALKLFLEREITASPLTEISSNIFVEKFNDVKHRIIISPYLKDSDICTMMKRCTEVFQRIIGHEKMCLPMGICHGDLTFSNILFNGNNYYLIDFLDSFIESPLLDIVKIRQDSAYLWSQMMYIHDFDDIRLKLICEKIDKSINDHFLCYKWYQRYYKSFQLMNFLRILQYAKEPQVIYYLNNIIGGLLDEF